MYVQDYDDTLPTWQIRGPGGMSLLWTDFLRPYYRDTRLLDEGLTRPAQKRQMGWVADYAMCAWGSGGQGTAQDPYWRWPGAPWNGPPPRPMNLAEVRRPAETMQFADGSTGHYDSNIRRRHRNNLMNGAFLDAHARLVTNEEWDRVGHDDHGYFYRIAAADR